MKVLLDSGVLALLVSPIQDMSEAKENEIYQCTEWFYSLLSKGVFILASEISDYEVRRELIRIKSEGIKRLNDFRDTELIDFLPLDTNIMQKAAYFWADARQNHIPTSDDKNTVVYLQPEWLPNSLQLHEFLQFPWIKTLQQ